MRRIPITILIAAVWAPLATACVDGRTRPLLAVDDERRDPNGPPLVYITHPQDGQVLFPEHWVNGSGVQVTYAGEFRVGDELRMLAYLDYVTFSATRPFHITEFVISEAYETAAFVQAESDQFRDVVGVTILLEIYDPEGYLVSTDSVGVEIR